MIRFFVALGKSSIYIASFALGAVIFGLIAYKLLLAPLNSSHVDKVNFQVVQGDNLRSIANRLERQKIIRNANAFYYVGRLRSGRDEEAFRKLVVGEYPLSASQPVLEILGTLMRGDVVYYSFTVPEGSTLVDIARIIGESDLVDTELMRQSLFDRSIILQVGVPSSSLEGYLFPETYRFTKPITPEQIITKMYVEGEQRITPEMRMRASELTFDMHQVRTLASIIERETGKAEERPIVSSVFHNRLRIGMPLQSDPTVIYGIPNFEGRLTRADLSRPSPYNTYLNAGLPPTPIANPGIESIRAALYPADTEYLFFVSKNDGSHHFSTSYKEHQEAVNRYQRGGGGQEVSPN